ncbi:MAG TPA: hypothetical protein VGK56_11550 [Anaerolineales bacterium]
MMNRITPHVLVFLFASLLAACSRADSSVPVTGQESDLRLEIESPNGESAFRQGDQAITYNYVVTNTGPQSLSGPVIVQDDPRVVVCPQLNIIGNLDSNLDFNESVTCTANYTPSEQERSAGSITNRARAIVGGVTSNESTYTLGQAAAGPTRAGADDSQTPSAVTPETSADSTQMASTISSPTLESSAAATQAPSVISTATPGVSTDTTQAPSGIASATPDASANITQTPADFPTATLGSSANVTPGATASADTVNVIDLPAGTDTILLPGVVPAGGTIRYSINAAQGQQLSLNFVVTTNQLAVTVTGPDGAVVKARELIMPWSQSLASAGDFLIEVQNMDNAAAQPYLLELRLTPAN